MYTKTATTHMLVEVLVDKTYGSLVNISLNMHGARAVQADFPSCG